MNDFTKEELSLCYRAIEFMLFKKIWVQPETRSFHNKLRSMIDNYCEHDGEIGKDYPAEKCMKCKRMWE